MTLFERTVSLVALLAIGGWAAPLQEPQVTTGTRTGALSIRLAVPQFKVREPRDAEQAARSLTAVFNEVLWDDLDHSGILTLVSRSFYPIRQSGRPENIRPWEWTGPDVDAQFLAFGNTRLASGRFIVEARLWDLKTQPGDREAVGQRYTGDASPSTVRLMAHQFADRIVQLLGGGIAGIAQTKIAFVSDRSGAQSKEIYVMDYDGHDPVQLTRTGSLALTPSWSPDGERVAFTSYEHGKPDIAIVSRIDGRAFPFREFQGTTTTPVWSPDGRQLAFASSMGKFEGRNDMEIHVAEWTGRNARRLTVSRGVDISPSWNPRTGRQIAFVSDRSGTPQIYVADAAGGNVQRIISEGGEAVNPSWSPDGQTLAFAWRRPGSRFDIYLYDLATGKTVQLTANSGENEHPSWAPDGRHIVFESTRLGRQRQIFSMLADGTKVRRLTRTGNNQSPSWSGYIGP